MSNHYVNKTKKEEVGATEEAASINTSIKILAEIIANQIIKKLLQDEQFGIAASTDGSQVCQESQAA